MATACLEFGVGVLRASVEEQLGLDLVWKNQAQVPDEPSGSLDDLGPL